MMESPDFHSSRRNFLLAGSASMLAGANALSASPSSPLANPYSKVNWSRLQQIGSGTHIHCRSQRVLEILYRRGLRHLAISNYYPSVPCTADERAGQYRVKQEFAVVSGEGYIKKTFRWNDIITDPETGWVDDLPTELQESLPFEVGPPLYADLPEDVILCPNAEHHSLTDMGGHFNAVGSNFRSGTFDVRGKYHLNRHGFPIGVGLPWKETFDRVFAELQFPDGGGLTINHPIWSGLNFDDTVAMLDYDPRVLGIEIWNQTCQQLNEKGWAVDRWDEILRTGRHCFGFSVSDHAHSNNPNFLGHNVLLVDRDVAAEDFPAACLRAYRDGRFYCVLTGAVQFRLLQLDDNELRIEVNRPSEIRIISASGQVHQQTGTRASWALPTDAIERQRLGYLRVEAIERDGSDHLFSQPIRFLQ